jgi:hypothetical protein
MEEAKKTPPTRIREVEAVEPVFPAAYLGLVRGEIVYVWGAPVLPANGGKVLAYEKKVESEAGWVLMQDGELKSMQPDEFSATPKATK